MKGSFRNLSVDLGCKNSREALEILLNMERRSKVRSARVFTSTGYISRHSHNTKHSKCESDSQTKALFQVFENLAKLPGLRHLTVNLHQHFPLEVLCSLLRSGCLKSLTIEYARLTGLTMGGGCEPSEHEDITVRRNYYDEGVSNSNLQELTLLHCQGTCAIERLVTGFSQLKVLNIAYTPLCACGIVRSIVQSPQLHSLKLRDVDGLTDDHIEVMALELADNASTSSLRKLEVTSNLLGSSAGQALAQMMFRNRTIISLTMDFDWEYCGKNIAEMLGANRKLRSLNLRLYGDDESVQADAILIAQVLQGCPRKQQYSTCSLRHLRFCVEIEPAQAGQLISTLDGALESNDTLRSLKLDDNMEGIPLPLTLKTKLRLNSSGARKLLRCHQSRHHQFVRAIISQRGDIHTIFHILSNQPSLIISASLVAEDNKSAEDAALYFTLSDSNMVHSDSTKSADQDQRGSSNKGLRSVRRRIKHLFALSA